MGYGGLVLASQEHIVTGATAAYRYPHAWLEGSPLAVGIEVHPVAPAATNNDAVVTDSEAAWLEQTPR